MKFSLRLMIYSKFRNINPHMLFDQFKLIFCNIRGIFLCIITDMYNGNQDNNFSKLCEREFSLIVFLCFYFHGMWNSLIMNRRNLFETHRQWFLKSWICREKLSLSQTTLSQWINKSWLYYNTTESSTTAIPADNYIFKVNNRNTRTRCGICSKLTIKAFIVNFEHI